MLKAYKYKLYPTSAQETRLQEVLDRCRELYNAALQERRDAYRMAKVSIRYNQQAAQLPEIKEIRPEYQEIHSQVLQDTLRRVDKAVKAFFRRNKNGEKPGYPRFQGYGRSLLEHDGLAAILYYTGSIQFDRGKFAEAAASLQEGLSLARRGTDQERICLALIWMLLLVPALFYLL